MGVANPKGSWAPKDSLDKLTTAAGEGAVNPDTRPDVVAAAADLSKTQADLALQKAIRIPDPTFSLFYEHNPPNTPGPDTFGLGVSFPLPLWNLNRGNIRAAQATTEQSALTLGKLEAQARADIADAEIAYAEARRRSGLYENEIRPRAARVRETIAFAYQKGGASLVDLLTAERDDNSIRLAAAEALADAANAAADLNSARNVVPTTQLTSKQ
jgi:cobalt-zinc-cadmium efflux system outer membrane protein